MTKEEVDRFLENKLLLQRQPSTNKANRKSNISASTMIKIEKNSS
jgi:hypothetical protein